MLEILTSISYIFIFEWIIRIVAIFAVPPNRKPTAGLSWLMFIFLLPIPGMLVFLVLGSAKLPPLRRKSQEINNKYVTDTLNKIKSDHPELSDTVDCPVTPEHQSTATLAKELTGLSVVGNNTVEYITSYDKIIKQIADDVRKAKYYAYVEFFIMALDDATEPLFDAMQEAAGRGVTVRVLYDYWGSFRRPGYKQMLARLNADGVHHLPMLPLRLPGKGYVRPDLRNHRKLVVVDDAVGYTGSLNMIDRSYHRKDDILYDELMIRLQGVSTLQLKSVFIADWYSETGDMLVEGDVKASRLTSKAKHGTIKAQVVPSGPGYHFENNLKVLVQLFHEAKHKIVIVNPYFVPDESLITALASAAQRGVDVTLLNSEAIDQIFVAHAQSSYYRQMIDAGVKIYHYNKPELLHSKYFIVDDMAAVGSSNADIRSFQLNHELIVMLYDKQVATALHKITDQYLSRSKHLSSAKWAKRSTKDRLLDNIARLTSALQ